MGKSKLQIVLINFNNVSKEVYSTLLFIPRIYRIIFSKQLNYLIFCCINLVHINGFEETELPLLNNQSILVIVIVILMSKAPQGNSKHADCGVKRMILSTLHILSNGVLLSLLRLLPCQTWCRIESCPHFLSIWSLSLFFCLQGYMYVATLLVPLFEG